MLLIDSFCILILEKRTANIYNVKLLIIKLLIRIIIGFIISIKTSSDFIQKYNVKKKSLEIPVQVIVLLVFTTKILR